MATLQLLTKKRTSVSRPMRNRYRTSPRLATRVRFGNDSVGKMAARNPGTFPMTEGPKMMPPMTSAITRGWRIFLRGQWRMWHTMMINPAYHLIRHRGTQSFRRSV